MQIEQRLENDSVAQLCIEGSRNTVVLAKEKVRTVLGADVIPYRTVFPWCFAVAGAGHQSRRSGYQPAQQSREGDRQRYAERRRSSSRTGADFFAPSFDLGRQGSRERSEASGTGIRFWKNQLREARFTSRDSGHGHGVGMPQTSAREMARNGYGYRDILTYYYMGIDIVQADRLSGDLR